MLHTFLKGINLKRYMMAMVGVFVFIFASNFVIHHILLHDIYVETMSLWRTEADMHTYFIWMIVAQLVYAKYFCYMFAKGFENKGMAEGVRFGMVAGFFLSTGCLIQFVTTPMPMNLMWYWILANVVQGMGSGIVASMIYKK